MVFGNTFAANAQNLDAGYILRQMDADKRYSYVSGIVEGLAYGRFLRDRPNQDGLVCITNWWAGNAQGNWTKVKALFERHSDKPPAPLLQALINRECGK